MPRRRCRNCPKEAVPEALPPKTMAVVSEEGKKLWHQSLFTCNTVVEMMAGYAMLGVPGSSISQLRKLAGRINDIIQICDKREHNEN
jgi:hypothetical protein